MANTRVNDRCIRINWGPYVCPFVGIISGLSRVYIGGADAYTYLISSIIIGLTSGFIGHLAIKIIVIQRFCKGSYRYYQ